MYFDELPKGNATYGFFPLWNPHSSLPDAERSNLTNGNLYRFPAQSCTDPEKLHADGRFRREYNDGQFGLDRPVQELRTTGAPPDGG